MKTNLVIVLTIIISLNLISLIKSDTPANCTYDDIQGQWIFSESERYSDRKEFCNGSEPVVNKVKIDLLFPDTAVWKSG
jgi:cathepsin C